MSSTLYHNPRCSKSRQTLQLLNEQGVDLDVVEYLKTPPDYETLDNILNMLNMEPRELMRKGEDEYSQQGLDNSSLGREQLIQAMLDTPKLIERPILIKDGKAVIGRPPELVLELI